MTPQARLDAFLSPGRDVFSGIQQTSQLWQPDPFDVETLNAAARQAFERLIARAVATPPPDSGKMLLVLGESGSGKTHLLRAFRTRVHGQRHGYVGYMPMTVDAADYDRYILSNLLTSLDRPYDVTQGPDSGLMRMSAALIRESTSVYADHIPAGGVKDHIPEHELHGTIQSVAEELRDNPRFQHVEVDVLRALLYLQRREQRYYSRILKWLRCEELSATDRKVIGELSPQLLGGAPRRMVEQLGQLMGALGQALVLCVDQVEDMHDHVQRPEMEPSFRLALNSLRDIASSVPTAVVVVCCLSDFWETMRPKLTKSLLDRIEHDPEPVDLARLVTPDMARDIAAQRLRHLFAQHPGAFDESDPTWPFPAQGFERLDNARTRDVLDACRRYRERAIQERRLPETFPLPEGRKGSSLAPPPVRAPSADLEQAWTNFRARFKASVPEDASEIAALLAWAIQASGDELGDTRFSVQARDAETLEVNVQPEGSQLLVALCNHSSRGGHLGRQMAEALKAAAGKVPVLVRTSDFPASMGTSVSTQLGALLKKGGRRAVLGDSDLRELVALQTFREAHPEGVFREWSQGARPITRLKSVSDILGLEKLGMAPPPGSGKSTARAEAPAPPVAAEVPRQERKAPEAPPVAAEAPARSRLHAVKAVPASADVPPGPVQLGTAEGLFAEPVTLSREELTRHSAFLGGSGSGKTTLALNVVEQLLLQGIPTLLVDRKGDLASYAREASWEVPLKDPVLAERRRLLRERVEVALYTPGRSDGRPLAIPVVPRGLESLLPEERDQCVQQAADALAGMLDYKNNPRDRAARTVLAQALRLLVERPPAPELTLDMVKHLVESQDPALLQDLGGLDPKVFPKLVQDLTVLSLNMRTLLASSGERLDVEELLGRGPAAVPGRTRLSIISTKFLGDTPRVLFWVAQLLLETNRWASQHPASQLQAVLLFDEADLYLPAVGVPATKQPMENLLKRARSAGVGVMLATQSPGDFDYKCRENVRNWFVGRIRETTALNKLKPMFSDARVDAAAKLPAQKTGQFHVQRDGQVQQLKADRSVLLTEQLSEEEILQLARQTLERGAASASRVVRLR
jgi:energy-coupling factor transporter ATP-binding protein EcfA2